VKLVLLLIAFFGLGFVVGGFLVGNTPFEITALSQPSVLGKQDPDDDFITHVDYDGKRFKSNAVTINIGNYITITNQSKKELMWLVSNLKDLNTVRGYGEGERVQAILTQKGEFKVMDKLTQSLLVVTVK
jgi:hypothetical protein